VRAREIGREHVCARTGKRYKMRVRELRP